MKFLKVLIFLLLTHSVYAQQPFSRIATPLVWTQGGFDSLFLPNHDTIIPKDKSKAWVVVKDTTIYIWKGLRWQAFTGGGSGSGGVPPTNIYVGTIAQLRASNTSPTIAYFSTDRGGDQWLDIGLSDGTVEDDGARYILTANNRILQSVSFNNTKEIDLKKFGLPCDGTMHTIASLFPSVTLSQVQAFDNTATLSSSADWYIISKLLKTLPIQSTILLSGSIVIDREIIIKRGFVTIKGINSNKTDIYLNHKAKIKQQGNGKDVFKIIDGDGTTYGYGAGHVEHVYFDNILIEGTMTAANQSGNGFSLHFTTGTAIGLYFRNVSVRGCLNGFKHFTGHVNDFFFDQCDFSSNFDAGFITNGNPSNQTNYFTFKDCSFNANGYGISGGSLIDFVQDTANPTLTKGGFIANQVVAFYLSGASAQSNNGYGFDFGNGAHLGISLNGYSEANDLGDLHVWGAAGYNRNVVAPGFYSSSQSYVFDDEAVKNTMLFLPGSNKFSSLNSTDIVSTNTGKIALGNDENYPPLSKLDVRDVGSISEIRTGYLTSANGIRMRWNNDANRSEIMNDGNAEIRLGMNGDRMMSLRPNGGVVIGVTPVYTYADVPDNGLRVEGPAQAAPATQPADLLQKAQLDSAYLASLFILRNAGGAGDSLMSNPTTSTAIMKRFNLIGAGTSKAITDTTITYTIDGIFTGLANVNGNGSQTTFDIVLDHTPTWIGAPNPANAAAVGITYTEAITNGIRVHFATAPPSGSANVSFYYSYK